MEDVVKRAIEAGREADTRKNEFLLDLKKNFY